MVTFLTAKLLNLICLTYSDSGGDPSNGRAAVALSLGGPTPVPVSTTSNTSSTTGNRECAGCGKRITERFLLKALDMFWHEDCLKCGCCDCRLGEVGSTLYTKANLILCKRDYLRLFGTTGYCAACNKVIPAFEMVMRAKNNVYHLECFACQQCNHRFCVGDRFYLCENKILCEYDYEERLVFANMAYNPSSLAHIRRQVSNLQQTFPTLGIFSFDLKTLTVVGFSFQPSGGGLTDQSCYSATSTATMYGYSQPLTSAAASAPVGKGAAAAPRDGTAQRDDGSSGYGSPDSEIFDPPAPIH
ncbi:unnamed protein product [Brassicogethes aeneus]|uniref:LIM zinc-binding domain-containing protein n=1 Tax=Brassicogethes aeneus TaxID=1431903 RepID=A0A9P0BCZ5_BRAAE|nr:unnamed protein product [Brassicogethes aeneus]